MILKGGNAKLLMEIMGVTGIISPANVTEIIITESVFGRFCGGHSMTHLIHCKKYQRLLPALEVPDGFGPISEKGFRLLSAQGWDLWNRLSLIIINENRMTITPRDGVKQLQVYFEQYLRDSSLERQYFGKLTHIPGFKFVIPPTLTKRALDRRRTKAAKLRKAVKTRKNRIQKRRRRALR